MVRASSGRQETMWRETKRDFDALSHSLLNVQRAIEVVRDQLTVPLRDAGARFDVNAVLERSLQPDEFERDVEVEPGTGRRVEFAVRLSDNPLTKVWLPISVLSAVDGYHELVAAGVYDNAEQLNGSTHTFETCVLDAAVGLNGKFIAPPHTMNLAILFVPTDDMYEEIARRDNLVETLRRSYHVIVAGPATLPTLVRALREAFRGTASSTAKVANGSAMRGI
jgi:DNA recombination protein RmuC